MSPLPGINAPLRCLLIVACLSVAGGLRATSIVVNVGRYPNAEAPGDAKAERSIGRDANTADDTVCTESFAALELQRCLRRVTGGEHDFSIVSDQTLPQGELILVGGPPSNAVSRTFADALGVGNRLDYAHREKLIYDLLLDSEFCNRQQVLLGTCRQNGSDRRCRSPCSCAET